MRANLVTPGTCERERRLWPFRLNQQQRKGKRQTERDRRKDIKTSR